MRAMDEIIQKMGANKLNLGITLPFWMNVYLE
jgi:hypothetical protein